MLVKVEGISKPLARRAPMRKNARALRTSVGTTGAFQLALGVHPTGLLGSDYHKIAFDIVSIFDEGVAVVRFAQPGKFVIFRWGEVSHP